MTTSEHIAHSTSSAQAGDAPAPMAHAQGASASHDSMAMHPSQMDMGSSPVVGMGNSKAPHASALPKEEIDPSTLRTPGWKLFNGMVYGGIAYGVNTLLGISLGIKQHQFEFDKAHPDVLKPSRLSKMLKPLFQMNEWLTTRSKEHVWAPLTERVIAPAGRFFTEKGIPLLRNLPQDIEGQQKFTRTMGSVTGGVIALSWAGTALLPLMKTLENNKVSIIKKLDTMLDKMRGRPLTQEEQATRDAAHEQLETNFAKEIWGALVKSRMVGLATVILAFSVPTLFDKERHGFYRISNSFFTQARKFFDKPGRDLPTFLRDETSAVSEAERYTIERAQNTAKFTVIEGLGTAIYAVASYVKLKWDEIVGKPKAEKPEAEAHTTHAEPAEPKSANSKPSRMPVPFPEAAAPTQSDSLASAEAASPRFTDKIQPRKEAISAQSPHERHTDAVQQSRENAGEQLGI